MKTQAIVLRQSSETHKRTIQTIFIAFALSVFAISSLFAQSKDADDAYLIKQFDTGKSSSVTLKTSGGSIQIIGDNRDDVMVEIYVRKNNRYLDRDDYDISDDYDLDLSHRGSEVEVVAKSKDKGWSLFKSRPSVSYIAYVPYKTLARLHTSGGSLRAADINGDIELRTSGGSIRVEEITGRLDLKTSGGSIRMKDISGDTDATTSGGSIRVEGGEGEFNVRTSGGSIRVSDFEGSIEGHTSGGSIRGDFKAIYGPIDLRTSGGSVKVSIPKNAGADLELRGNRVHADLVNFTGDREKNSISGTINGGGYPIKLRTSGGSVTLDLDN